MSDFKATKLAKNFDFWFFSMEIEDILEIEHGSKQLDFLKWRFKKKVFV